MKNIKLLLISCALMGISNSSNAQAMVYDSTNYLNLFYHTSRDYSCFTTNIVKQNMDSTWFTSHHGQEYLAVGKKVYRLNSFLVFDFDKKEGDTIVYNSQLGKDTVRHTPYIIDSIRNKVLLNNKTYRHFYCSPEKEATGRRMIYIEGFGEAMYAWVPGDLFSVPEQHGIVAICIGHNELVKWDSVLIRLNNDQRVDPNCSFDSLKNRNLVKFVGDDAIGVFPNPAINEVALTLNDAPKNAKINIYNSQGILVKTMVWQGAKTIKVNTQNFSTGIYLIEVNDENQKFYSKLQVAK